MKTKRQILSEKRILSDMRDLTFAYQEIAATRMQKTRAGVLANRDYLSDMSEVYGQVQKSYNQQIKKIGAVTEDKVALVLISANQGLYGDIVNRSFNLFKSEWDKNASAMGVIIGRMGKTFVEQTESPKPFTYFDFPDEKIDLDQTKKLSQYLLDFKTVRVFFGKFETVVKQTPSGVSLTGTEVNDKDSQKVNYLFEPDLPKVYAFFKSEIFASLLIQSLSEGMLSRFASRMVAMDSAGGRIDRQAKNTLRKLLRLSHDELSRRQMEVFGAIRAWRAI